MTKILKPPNGWRSFWTYELAYDAPLVLCGCAGGSVASWKMYSEAPPNRWASAILAIVALASLVAGLSKAVMKYRQQRKTESPDPLDAVLHTIHSMLTRGPSAAKREHALRICVFVPIPGDGEHVHQQTNYVGTATPYGAGNKISCRSGIVGEALRSNRAAYSFLPNGMALVDFLVQDFGFTREEGVKIKGDSKSWAGIPVAADGKVVAVIFADSIDKEFWNKTRRRILEASAIGVAEYVTRS